MDTVFFKIGKILKRWHSNNKVSQTNIITILLLLIMFTFINFISQKVCNEYLISPINTNACKTDICKPHNAMVNVYLFWGKECRYCEDLIKTLNTMAKRHPGVFRVYGLETWHNKDNEKLFKSCSKNLNIHDDKVPLLIIGNKVFQGYDFTKNLDSQIEKAIMDEYGNFIRNDIF